MFNQFEKIIWGISKQRDGSMKLLDNEADNKTINNQQKFLKTRGINYDQVIIASTRHGSNAKVVSQAQAGSCIIDTDGLITKEKEIILAVTVADCLPIYFYDHKENVIGLVHAGWRGVRGNIVPNTINTLKTSFSSNPNNIFIYIGPHINNCHFEVKQDVASKFLKYPQAVLEEDKKTVIDLAHVVKQQASRSGVKDKNINVSPFCTFCTEDYYSYRRDKPERLQAMIAYIGQK